MVASLDGSTVVDGRSGALSNPNDSELFLTLRDLADVIVVGAGTARAEGYGPPRKVGQRVGVVSNTGRVDADSALFASGAGFLIVPESAPATTIDTLRAGATSVDLALAASMLTSVVGAVRFVHAEGGPHLNGALATADLIDELNLTLSPHVAGGDGPTAHGRWRRRAVGVRPGPPRGRRGRVRLQPVGEAPSLLSSSISRWKSAATSKSLYTDANRR